MEMVQLAAGMRKKNSVLSLERRNVKIRGKTTDVGWDRAGDFLHYGLRRW
jgi:hypothetical protein